MKRCPLFILLGVAAGLWLFFPGQIHAQGTAFTYQGRLAGTNGLPLTGNFDMQFKLHPAATGSNQVGATLTNAPVAVNNGLFSVTLDFTVAPFTGNPLWLEIGVRTNGSVAAYDVVSPNQPLTATPYAIRALSFAGAIGDTQLSTNVPRLNGTNIFSGPVTFSNASGIFNGTVGGTFNGTGTLSGTLSGTFSGTGSGTFNGNGAGLTNLNVTNLVGVVLANPNWQLVQGTSQQAVSANNYLATNPAVTSLNLPASPGVGDVLRFSGSGSSGWKLTQNTNQSILTTALGLPAGKNWTSNSPITTWRALASSADGVKLAAAAYNGPLYTSTNGGQSWLQRLGNGPWYALASSVDGTHLALAPNGSFIAISQDSGATWTNYGTSQPWSSIASSSSGVFLAAAVNGGYIYTSTNSGSNWIQRATSQPWYSIASSADGLRLAAVINNGQIYTSVNAGATWALSANSPTKPWYSIASSADGTKLVAACNNEFIYTSADAGANWVARASYQPWFAVACSRDAACMVGVVNNGLIYSSFDSGQTWIARTPANQPWNAVCVSADGTRAAAGLNGGEIYTSISATTTGAGGYLSGNQYSNVELQYVGGGLWMVLGFAGTFGEN